MNLASWLESVRNRLQVSKPRRRQSAEASRQSEALEDRTLLTVTTLFYAGELSVISDAADDIAIQEDTNIPGNVEVLENGVAATSISNVAAADVDRIVVQGSDQGNSVDLDGVTAGLFTNLQSIEVIGGNGNDTILGSVDLADSITGGDGNDTITGQGGNDTINGEDGADELYGGGGDDSLIGHDGGDIIEGNGGNDVIEGGDGEDTINGNGGDDSIDGGHNRDVLNGDDGNDTINGGAGDDMILGDAGDDSILGGAANDSIVGGDGLDSLLGQGGHDTLQGGNGEDYLDSGDGNDLLQGENANDFLNGGRGDDTMDGGADNDTLFGGSGSDSMTGGSGDDLVRGQSSGDTVTGGGGQDYVDGGSGNDLVTSDPDGATPPSTIARLFAVPSDGTNSIVELDPANGAELRRFAAPEPVSTGPDALAYDGTNLFFLNGFGTDILWELDPNTGTVIDADRITVGTGNYDGLAALNGTIYFLDYAASDIVVFDPVSDTVQNVLDIDGLNQNVNLLVGGMAGIRNPDRLVVTDFLGLSVYEVDPATGLITSTFTPSTPGAGNYLGAGVINGEIYLGTSDQGLSGPGTIEFLDVFSRSGILQRSIALPYGVSAIGADDIGGTTPTPPPTSNYDIVINFGSGLTPSQQAIFTAAEQRWESIITGDVPDVFVPGVGNVDDLVISATGAFIDGPGGILGGAAPSSFRTGTFLPASGDMIFDTADLASMEANGELLTVVLHEMAHVLGFGTIWEDLGLLSDPSAQGGTDPRFTGTAATSEYNNRFGNSESGVPVEATGGPGTADSHWRESVFDNELMTGFINSGSNPLSAMTVAQFADLGYVVDMGQADPYIQSAVRRPSEILGKLIVLDVPRTMVDPNLPLKPADPAMLKTDAPDTDVVPDMSGFTHLEVEPNDSIATAQNMDGETWTLDFDANIGDSVTNTSTTIPHITISGTGDGTYDFYSFTVSNAGDRGIFDIDFGATTTQGSMDTELFLFDSAGNLLASDDDFNTTAGAGGSTSALDSFIEYTFAAPGLYVIGVAEFPSSGVPGGITGEAPDLGDTYTLQVSVQNHGTSVPTPGPGPAPTADAGDTLLGGTGQDTVIGGWEDDLLSGDSGDDQLDGGAGDDLIFGGAGSDTLNGSAGDDTLQGQGGTDSVSGDEGDDTIVWAGEGDGIDSVEGGDGADTVEVRGDNSNNAFTVGQNGSALVVSEGTGSITVVGTVETVQINAGRGDDAITVNDVDQVVSQLLVIDGQAGADRIDASGANVGNVRLIMMGDAGDDTLLGSEGDDTLYGGDDNDQLAGNGGDDSILGEAGHDALTGGGGNDILDGGDGVDTMDAGDGDDSLTGGDGIDSMSGGGGNDTMNGGDGDDKLNGSYGNDSILGDAGADLIFGGAGDDTLDGGRSDDTLFGQGGNDRLRGDHGNDSLDGASGDDTLNGGDGDDSITGGDGMDGIAGMDGDDHINAGRDNDTAIGGDGNDTILGGAGDDVALGENGNDYINGNGGFDTLAGGEGTNTLVGSAAEIDETFTLPDDVLADLEAL